MAIDWTFLEKVEGKENTTYIPMEDGEVIQNSGVTVGTGVDLGAQSRAKFEKLGISEDIIKKLEPFFKKSKDKAVKALEENGVVTLSDEEVFEIDKALKKNTLQSVKKWYNKDNTLGQDWSDLSDRQQTVVLSVFYNHGMDGAPNFKEQVETGKWSDAIENLRKFYKTTDNQLHSRRVKEAQYLAGLPPEQIDGIDGDITAAAVEEFKNTVGVSTPDEVRPEQPQIGSMSYLDNIMAMIQSRSETPQRASKAPSRERMRPEQSRMDRLRELMTTDAEQQYPRAKREAQLQRTAREAQLAETAREAERKAEEASEDKKKKERMDRLKRLMTSGPQNATVTFEEDSSSKGRGNGSQTRERKSLDRDPIFGIF